jgi:hypothetical protein
MLLFFIAMNNSLTLQQKKKSFLRIFLVELLDYQGTHLPPWYETHNKFMVYF